jgi:hypothetical protein
MRAAVGNDSPNVTPSRMPKDTNMPIEQLNGHTHDAGFFHRDWDYATDKTVDLATEKLNAAAHDGVDASEALDFIKSGSDFGQVTDREARQISAQLRNHYDQMNPEAKKIADRFEATFQERLPSLHDSSDEALSGYNQHWLLGEGNRFCFPDSPILEGSELESFLAGLNSIANPYKQAGTSAVSNSVFSSWSSLLRG